MPVNPRESSAAIGHPLRWLASADQQKGNRSTRYSSLERRLGHISRQTNFRR